MSFYQTLLTVAVEHRYNRGGACRCLDFRPTARTRRLLEQGGMLLRATADGIRIVYDRDRLEALQLLAGNEQDPFSFDFRVFATDPEFRIYTEPYAAAADQILYFDNRAAATAAEVRLGASGQASDADLRPADAAEFDGVLEQRDRLVAPEFVLRLFAESDRGPLLEQWLGDEPTVYRIGFDSRSRYWKYYLLGRILNNGAEPQYFIDDADRRIEFEATGEEFLADRKRAVTFRSKQRIPLNEHYRYRFQLKKKGQNGETVVIPSLPFASVKQVGMERIAEQDAIVSEIYINS